MLPQFEQQPLANAFNYDFGTSGLAVSGLPGGIFVNRTVFQNKLSVFQCPSDRDLTFGPAFGGLMDRYTKGNYVVSWGNTGWAQERRVYNDAQGNPIVFLPSAFGHAGNISLASIRDGTSNTVFMAEILQGSELDIRGTLWTTLAGASSFNSRFTPNQSRDVYGVEQRDQLLNGFCVDEPGQRLPCANQPNLPWTIAGSRSAHAGGVNVQLGDGSVRFVRETIDPFVWLALNSFRGGEVISADAF